MTETTDKLPPLPEGAVYAGQLKDFAESVIAGWVHSDQYSDLAGWYLSGIWTGMAHAPDADSGHWHLAVRADSDFARRHGLADDKSAKPGIERNGTG